MDFTVIRLALALSLVVGGAVLWAWKGASE